MKKHILFLLLVVSSQLSAQTVSVNVLDASNSSPLPGATITVKGTGKGVATDANGSATIEANPVDTLQIQLLGFQTQNVPVNNQNNLVVSLVSSTIQMGEFIVVGTRRPGRLKTESPVPVDVISIREASLPTGRMDLTSLLNYSAPSLNFNKQNGSDGADHVDLATLRGLGPDQTLVLVNGKRRHQTAFVSVFGTRGRGNSGTDMNAIPVSAIDRVEILRDGASAQYGSDAIAGVINIVLKQTTNEFTGDIGYGGHYDKKFNPAFEPELRQYQEGEKFDGAAFSFNGNYGVPLGKKDGFLNFSASFLSQTKTLRQVLDTSNLLTNEDALPINIYRRGNGDGEVKSGGIFVNLETPISSGNTRFYAFGGYNYSSSDAFAFSRNFSARPERFPTDANGDLIFVDGIMHITPDGETFYDPHIQTRISDGSMAIGMKGRTHTSWIWDISNNTGRNDFHFYGDKTFNASLGTGQTHFDDGGFSFLQNTTNVNFSREFAGLGEGFNFAAGAEYRMEKYDLYAGEAASYSADPSGVKASGAQGFPGYQPGDEANESRSTIGAYVDAEMDITKSLLLTAAIRAENYSDFGFTSNYKLSTRLKATDKISLRGSASTGFRAPSLQQINFSSTFTTVQGGLVAEVKIAPNDNPITRAAGIEELQEEKSVNACLGLTFNPSSNFSIAVDAYLVKVEDRVVLSGQFDAGDATLDPVFLAALNALNASYAQFFANAVNTTNRGVDVVMEYRKVNENNSLRATLAGNFQSMDIDEINVPAKLNDTEQHRQTFLSDREQAFILASAPELKVSLGFEYGFKQFSIGTRLTCFGSVTILGYGEDALGINPVVPTDNDPAIYVPDRYEYGEKIVTDLFASYKINKSLKLFLGADNLFGVHPDLAVVPSAKYWAFNNEPAGPWDAVQMGGNGLRLWLRLGMVF